MKSIQKIGFYFSLILLATCCKDKEPKPKEPITYTYTLGEAKNYIWAKIGSYWIYKNTATGELDTQTCTSFAFNNYESKGSNADSKHITVEYEKVYSTIYSSFNNWTYSLSTVSPSANATNPQLYRTIFRKEIISQFEGIIECFFHPFELGVHAGTGSHTCTYIGMDTTLTIQGKTYNNVVRFDIDMDEIMEKNCQYIPITTYFWARNVGLIKKNIKNCNYSWELIEYNIIK